MPAFMLTHRHAPAECAAAFAAWRGFESPLRHGRASSSCRAGGHVVWWRVEARTAADALALLPPYVAERTEVAPIAEVKIP